MAIKYLGLIKFLFVIYFFCGDVAASSINISAIQDMDISHKGDKKGFLETGTNLTWLDIGVMPPSFLNTIANGRINSSVTIFNGWRIAEENEVINLLMSIFPQSGLGNIGGTWGGTTAESFAFHRVATIFGISEAVPDYDNLGNDDFEYIGWRANASFMGEDGQGKVFYLGRQGSDGYLPAVEILGFSQSAVDSYIETFSVTPLFIAVAEPSSTFLLLFGITFLMFRRRSIGQINQYIS